MLPYFLTIVGNVSFNILESMLKPLCGCFVPIEIGLEIFDASKALLDDFEVVVEKLCYFRMYFCVESEGDRVLEVNGGDQFGDGH